MIAPNEETDVLLIGGGVASVRCARTLRREGFDGRILLVGDEPVPPYNRPPLSKELLRDDLPDDLVLAEPQRWYERRGIELRLGRRVVALDPEARRAELDDGSHITFGQALIATGARPRQPAFDGADRVLMLRTLADARRIRAEAREGGTAVVVGGGLIGVEVASVLATLGMRVTLVELSDRLWAGAFGDELSAWAEGRLTAAGVDVRLSTAVDGVDSDGVRVGAERLRADVVVAGIGVTPNDELARTAGLRTDGGIVTDADHRTSAVGILAAGDVARVDGRRVEHWHAAREGGERAALAMLGRSLPQQPPPWVFSEVAGTRLDVVGWAPTWDEIVELRSGHAPAWAYVVDGRVAQVAIVDGALPVEPMRAALATLPALAELPSAD